MLMEREVRGWVVSGTVVILSDSSVVRPVVEERGSLASFCLFTMISIDLADLL